MKEQRELQTLIGQLVRHIREQAEQIDALLKTNEHLTELSVKYNDEMMRLRRAISDELSITRAAEIFSQGLFKQRGVV
jgi:predicted  nucleic acid-binding Zn-ribbon protein